MNGCRIEKSVVQGYLRSEQPKDVAAVSDQVLSKQRWEEVDGSKESEEMAERLGREVRSENTIARNSAS